MAENRHKNAPKAFDIHRSLPVHPPITSRGLPPAQTTAPPKPKSVKKNKPNLKKTLFRILLLLAIITFAVAMIIGVWDGRNISAASKKLFGSSNFLSLVRGGNLKTDSNGRVNVLIVGYSIDDPGHQGANLTDSILLLSMSPITKTGYMLSIPRDLYIQIPDNGYGKINEVYEDGGIVSLEQVIRDDFGVIPNYYVLLDYGAVRDVVNALGGITVDIKSPDARGLYDNNISPADGGPLQLKNGIQTLDGQTALNLTRARGETESSYGFPQSDFDRTQHQRQVFTAVKAKLNWKLVLDPRKNSKILNALGTNIKTDIPASAARPLFGLFNRIPASELQSLSLNTLTGTDLLQSYTTYYGQSALVPAAGIDNYSQINAATQSLNK